LVYDHGVFESEEWIGFWFGIWIGLVLFSFSVSPQLALLFDRFDGT